MLEFEDTGCCLCLFLLLRLCGVFFLDDALDFVILIVYEIMVHFVECHGCSYECSVNRPIVFDH